MQTKLAAPRQRLLRALLVLPMLMATVVVAQVATAPPASAAEYGVRTELISRFRSGDVAYVKVAVERHPDTLKGRLHVKVYCRNSNNQSVNCGTIHASEQLNSLEYWNEATDHWSSWYQQTPCCDSHNVPSRDFWGAWICGWDVDQYRTVAYNVRVTDRFGEPGTSNDVPSNTANIFITDCV
jgi:hypothetical protein